MKCFSSFHQQQSYSGYPFQDENVSLRPIVIPNVIDKQSVFSFRQVQILSKQPTNHSGFWKTILPFRNRPVSQSVSRVGILPIISFLKRKHQPFLIPFQNKCRCLMGSFDCTHTHTHKMQNLHKINTANTQRAELS